jgi:hypothetical protein
MAPPAPPEKASDRAPVQVPCEARRIASETGPGWLGKIPLQRKSCTIWAKRGLTRDLKYGVGSCCTPQNSDGGEGRAAAKSLTYSIGAGRAREHEADVCFRNAASYFGFDLPERRVERKMATASALATS